MRRRGAVRAALAGAVFALTVALWPARAAAQVADRRVAVLPEPTGTAVALAVLVNAGTAWESEREAGLSHLAARAVVEEVAARLDALGAVASAHCGASAMGFTLLAPPATWRAAASLFLDALFRSSPADDAVARARAALVQALAREEGSPAADARLALREAHFGRYSRWARPPCGRAADVAALDAADVRRMLRTRFVPARAAAALAGPVTTREGLELLGNVFGDVSLPVLLPRPQPPPDDGRRTLIQPTVTTWIGWAFPLPAEPDAHALELLAFRIERAVGPAPARPEIYDLGLELERHGAGGALLISLVTAPDRAGAWAARVEDLIRRAASDPVPEAQFSETARRYLGRRLLDLATPEARALDAARQLFFDHGHLPPDDAVRDLTPERLRRAAASLGRPARAILAPD